MPASVRRQRTWGLKLSFGGCRSKTHPREIKGREGGPARRGAPDRIFSPQVCPPLLHPVTSPFSSPAVPRPVQRPCPLHHPSTLIHREGVIAAAVHPFTGYCIHPACRSFTNHSQGAVSVHIHPNEPRVRVEDLVSWYRQPRAVADDAVRIRVQPGIGHGIHKAPHAL